MFVVILYIGIYFDCFVSVNYSWKIGRFFNYNVRNVGIKVFLYYLTYIFLCSVYLMYDRCFIYFGVFCWEFLI